MPENWIHTLEWLGLIYLLLGAFLMMLLSGLGAIDSLMLSRIARGKPMSDRLMVLGIAFAILIWAYLLWKHRRLALIGLARNLWGRP